MMKTKLYNEVTNYKFTDPVPSVAAKQRLVIMQVSLLIMFDRRSLEIFVVQIN